MQLMLGDCLERMTEIPDGSVDLILTDPPYGMNYQSNWRVKSDKFERIHGDDSLDWLNGFAYQCHRVLRENSAIYVFCSWHQIDKFKQSFSKFFTMKNLLVWVKNNHGSGDLTGSYAPKHELVLYLHKGRSLLRARRRPDVIECAKIPGSKMAHPTEKPVQLCTDFITDSSEVGQIVLDPFMGSGTTGVACVNTSRNFIGIERDPGYFKIAEERIFAAQDARRV